MPNACNELFDYALGCVTPDDIADFAPSDPGYPAYVSAWRQILATGSLPAEADFDITETVGLTQWVDAKRETDPRRFRRFRVFTNAVALAMGTADDADDDAFPPNYTVISLIDDAAALEDPDLWRLLLPAFEAAFAAWRRQPSEEAAFALLGVLLVRAQQGEPEAMLESLAERLIEEEARCPHRVASIFLFGCTYYTQLNESWKRHVRELLPAASPSLSLIRDALRGGKSAEA